MKKKRPYAAHIREDDKEVQTVTKHLKNVAILAQKFAEPFGAGAIAYQCGLVHDVGKFSDEFQHRIWDNGEKTDHSTAGAQEIFKLCGALPAYCVAGHHAGLMDGGGRFDDNETATTLYGRLNKKISNGYKIYKNEVQLQKPQPPQLKMLGQHGFTLSFFTRMLFSCLVDADFLDTESFMQHGEVNRGNVCNVKQLMGKLNSYISRKHWISAKEGLNGKRSQILKTCIEMGTMVERGLFTLTVPTGGGKTISSLAFALHHAVRHGMKRIIYVIPYCSIIEQTADTFRTILGAKNVLAHYSGAQYDDEDEMISRQSLATENWDMPVVVTTAVQFFESLFSNRTSACRKLHSVTNSVVIFDEAQTLPLPYLKPCVDAIAELSVNYGTSCVLCTATQPALKPLFKKYAPSLSTREICPDTKQFYSFFRRVHYKQLGELTDDELAQRLSNCSQVLCIVSTRKQAKNVYGLLNGKENYHLSTLMTPDHRRNVLNTVCQRLKDKLPCRVVSTSLIEAGVDVDFPTVYRAYAGLDSEIQAGGRCNREGKNATDDSVVYLFKPENCYMKHLPDSMKRPVQEAYCVTRSENDIVAPHVIKKYFENLYHDTGSGIDKNNIVQRFEDGKNRHLDFPFRSVAKEFHIIENHTKAVLVPCDENSRAIAERFEHGECNRELFREASQYCVNVYENHFNELHASLHIIDESMAVLKELNLYDSHTGLSFENDGY
ncbi:CRISPR-associated helicase Cas3' [Sporolactobacillus sp. CQH2019]|uniref:CRISPR-associated helicase Cas3' n=1 Tax=Sporolactobacillus sp. CQH2019 TaxID=3023512 RepID=UPI002368E3C1|nr:CRISPR-associated helicase Cas3' [Sporolactobacillus sp. CQH2019]MDD9147993.1 CRISPR-associated helicase Cas3' [Sporolactobacillus sp. CQH2019]